MPHLSHDKGFTTLSDRQDPRRPAAVVPGGLVESVETTLDDDSETALDVNEAQTWLRLNGQEISLLSVIRGIERQVEAQFGLALVPQTVTAVVSGPAKEVALPRVPEQDLTSVKAIESGNAQSDESSDYYLLGGALKADTGRAVGDDPVEVVYDAGWDDPPRDLVLALKRRVGDHFDRRRDVQVDVSLEQMAHDATEIFRRYANQ